MCDVNAYIIKDNKEELLMESVDIIERNEDGSFLIIGMFGDNIEIKSNIKEINLIKNKILFQ